MSKELRVGVAGLGAIGRTHIDRIINKLHGAVIVGVTDADAEFGAVAAEEYRLPYYSSIKEMIASAELDGLMVTAADDEHERYVLAAVQAGLPVFCEEPLAPDVGACRRIVMAELTAGKRLIQVGFMRRYDTGHLKLRELVNSRAFGRPLMVHCAHRGHMAGESFTTPMAVSNALIHEMDYLRWLLGEDLDSVELRMPKRTLNTHADLQDPQMLLLTTQSGIWMDVECFLNSRTGYDIQCEVVCEEGILRLPEPTAVRCLTEAGTTTTVSRDWAERFVDAYNAEIQAWIDNSIVGVAHGPSAWDGFAACVAAEAAHESRDTGLPAVVEMPECPSPELYLAC